MRKTAILLCGLWAASACGRVQPYVEPGVAVPEADRVDEAAQRLVRELGGGDYDGLTGHTAPPLSDDLSRDEFEDLAAIVQWLGQLQSLEPAEGTASGRDAFSSDSRRSYSLAFEKSKDVSLDVSIDASGRLTAFAFSGEGYEQAERGVLSEPWREFKVYDFHLLDSEGARMPSKAPVEGTRIEYEVIVGGIEALLGTHHLRLEKTVLDPAGTPVFREPHEFDVTFDQDALGIPRGVVRGYVEVPGPGRWTMVLVISDENAHREIQHEHAFESIDG